MSIDTRSKVQLGVVLGALLLVFVGTIDAAESQAIQNITVAGTFFNPTIGQTASISFETTLPGLLTLKILDRDGYVVRTLIDSKDLPVGKSSLLWDGKNKDGQIVPDEAYSLKVDLQSKVGGVYSYFPANRTAEEVTPEMHYYDRQNRILSYVLPKTFKSSSSSRLGQTRPTDRQADGSGHENSC